ncbi:cell division protein FtsQ/DivIB [Listeria newyorkensis]|uniref:Cell division protein DivIB n=1 Tax=Listeria newyorkensis TaxID=1497681 RepID=A0A841YW50_9LIST|nr:cell division protein FtsQ/DivIB [Listeria newyorkensis]MBC1457535.1 cell division protein FtsQ/DivIB [Listeria newyorkensis]
MASNKKIVSIENRIPELKKYRKKKLIRHMSILISIFVLLILITLYFLSPLSKVQRIYVDGNHQVDEQTILTEGDLNLDAFVFGINKSKSTEALEKNPLIKKATIELQGLNTLRVHITENKTIGYQGKNGQYFDILETGKLLTTQPKQFPIGNNPIFSGFKNGQVLEDMVAQLNQLPEGVLLSISEIHFAPTKSDDEHISLYMNDGNQVSATISTFAEKMAHYPSIVAQLKDDQKGIIDLEIGSYFRTYLKDKEEKAALDKKN